MANPFPEDHIRSLPNAELHVHLEGSVGAETLLALAAEHGVEPPAPDADVPGAEEPPTVQVARSDPAPVDPSPAVEPEPILVAALDPDLLPGSAPSYVGSGRPGLSSE